jgi:F0F1-type ATP synthase membrane subunit c/vacuolar-type H+-ATPase subunit K
MSDRVASLIAEEPFEPAEGRPSTVKSHKRRSRVVAGLALLAASAAVASAMFGLAMAPSSSSACTAVSAQPSGQLRVAHSAHLPAKLAEGPRKRTARVISVSPGTGGPAIAAAGVAHVAFSAWNSPVSHRAWWLDYASTCSRTRGQPRTDVLA